MIETPRLILRPWRFEDRSAFYEHCSDPRVMAFLGAPMTRDECDAALERHNRHAQTVGYGFLAVERRDDGALMGFCGLKPGAEDTPIVGRVEIGWRFGHAYWGQGYAREAAAAWIDWGFANLPDDSIWAITAAANARSWSLMERLGMVRQPALDFDHPKVDDPQVRPHITYSIDRTAWSAS
jgi:RimJ/RimL family protein N-acetyltransferase